jgi:diguanylate cyclase (GGDEF)-like protein
VTGIGHVGKVAARLRFVCIEVAGSRLRPCRLDGRIDLDEWRLVTDTPGASEAEGDFTIFRSGRTRTTAKAPPANVSETQRLQMLNEISRVLTSRLDLREVYDTIYEQISRVMDTSMFFLALRLKDEDRVHIPYVREFGGLSTEVTTPAGRSVTTHVLRVGQPLLFHTAEQYERYALGHGLPVIVMGDETHGPAQSMIFAPLNTGSETIGTLSIQSTRRYAYTQTDVDTLGVIASQSAVAVQNARLYQASVESARRRQALIRVVETVNSSLELRSVLDSILDGIREVLPYHSAAIMLPDAKTHLLTPVGSVGDLPDSHIRDFHLSAGEGITGKVFQSGEPLVVQDVSSFDGYVGLSDNIRSEAAVPLKRGDTVLGVLNVERVEGDGFPDEDVELLTLFATQAAIAIENARLFEDQRNRVLQMQAIQSIVKEMTMLHENGAMGSAVERGLYHLIDFDECIIYLVNESGTELEPIPSTVGPTGRPRDARVPRVSRRLGEGISGWVWRHGESTIFQSSRSDPRAAQDVRNANVDMCVMAAPMMHRGRVSGVITVGKEEAGFYSEEALRDLDLVAGHAAVGFDRCRLYEELQVQATTDDLTGLFNRRHLNRRLREEKSRAIRNGHPLAAVMIDADDFKSVNDTHGHEAGDAVLHGLAALVRNELRTEDIVARYGGEEFLALLPEVDLKGAVAVADRLRRLVSTSLLAKDGRVGHIHVSIGIALLEPDDVADEIISRADHAMYEAKRNGGNRLCVCRGDELSLIPTPSASEACETAA